MENCLRDLKAWHNDPTTANLRFHALECIRALGYDMGLLEHAVQSPQNSVIPAAESRGNCLLPYPFQEIAMHT